jgi:hypothetical protein
LGKIEIRAMELPKAVGNYLEAQAKKDRPWSYAASGFFDKLRQKLKGRKDSQPEDRSLSWRAPGIWADMLGTHLMARSH